MYFMVQVEQIVRYVSDLSKTIFLQEQDKNQCLSVCLSCLSVPTLTYERTVLSLYVTVKKRQVRGQGHRSKFRVMQIRIG